MGSTLAAAPDLEEYGGDEAVPRAISFHSGLMASRVIPLSRVAMTAAPKSAPEHGSAAPFQARAADDAGGDASSSISSPTLTVAAPA